MKRSTVSVDTALKFRKAFIIIFLIICGIIVGVAAKAEPFTLRVHDRYTIIKKQNKVYSNACALLKEKRNKKEKVKIHRHKYR